MYLVPVSIWLDDSVIGDIAEFQNKDSIKMWEVKAHIDEFNLLLKTVLANYSAQNPLVKIVKRHD